MRKETKKYDDDFKKSSVELFLKSGKKQIDFAKELGISASTLRYWLSKFGKLYEAEPATDQEKLKKYQRELVEARMENDLLKKAIAIFSKNQ